MSNNNPWELFGATKLNEKKYEIGHIKEQIQKNINKFNLNYKLSNIDIKTINEKKKLLKYSTSLFKEIKNIKSEETLNKIKEIKENEIKNNIEIGRDIYGLNTSIGEGFSNIFNLYLETDKNNARIMMGEKLFLDNKVIPFGRAQFENTSGVGFDFKLFSLQGEKYFSTIKKENDKINCIVIGDNYIYDPVQQTRYSSAQYIELYKHEKRPNRDFFYVSYHGMFNKETSCSCYRYKKLKEHADNNNYKYTLPCPHIVASCILCNEGKDEVVKHATHTIMELNRESFSDKDLVTQEMVFESFDKYSMDDINSAILLLGGEFFRESTVENIIMLNQIGVLKEKTITKNEDKLLGKRKRIINDPIVENLWFPDIPKSKLEHYRNRILIESNNNKKRILEKMIKKKSIYKQPNENQLDPKKIKLSIVLKRKRSDTEEFNQLDTEKQDKIIEQINEKKRKIEEEQITTTFPGISDNLKQFLNEKTPTFQKEYIEEDLEEEEEEEDLGFNV